MSYYRFVDAVNATVPYVAAASNITNLGNATIGGAAGLYSLVDTQNETAQSIGEQSNAVAPALYGVGFGLNHLALGAGPVSSVVTGGGYGLGYLGGQYLARQILPRDAQGDQNQLLVGAGGFLGALGGGVGAGYADHRMRGLARAAVSAMR